MTILSYQEQLGVSSLLDSEDAIEGFHFLFQGRGKDQAALVKKLGRAPPFLLDPKLSSMLKRRRRCSGALAPNYEKNEFSSCRQRGNQSPLISGEARGASILPGGLFLYQQVKELSSFSVNWKELSS